MNNPPRYHIWTGNVIPLSMREQEILAVLATGPATLHQFAKTVGVKKPTIHGHIANMMRKTNTHNRVQLVLWALRNAQRVVATLPQGTGQSESHRQQTSVRG